VKITAFYFTDVSHGPMTKEQLGRRCSIECALPSFCYQLVHPATVDPTCLPWGLQEEPMLAVLRIMTSFRACPGQENGNVTAGCPGRGAESTAR